MPPDAATWTDRDLRGRLSGTRFGDLRWFDLVDSTNRYVLDAARHGAPEGLVVVADEQTAGRGRLGRRWHAPASSSLLVSVLLRPDPTTRSRVTMTAGVCMARAVESVAGFTAALKWPNDLVVRDRKLAGILAESDRDAVVVGAGCNVNWGAIPPELDGPRDLDGLRELEDVATACDLEVGRTIDRSELLVGFLRELDRALEDTDGVIDAYRERLETLGRRVRVERAADELHGEAIDLDPDGALVVATDDGQTVRVHVGDVIHLRAIER